jgi:pimeloyl-ACP methyl ester carboxylesterase
MPRSKARKGPTPPNAVETKRILEGVPQDPQPIRRIQNWPLALQSVADFVADAPGWLARLRGTVHKYPRPFEKIIFESKDGTRLSAWLGRHTVRGQETKRGSKGEAEPREGIVIVPGMFATKDNAIQKARGLKIFRDLGYHVLVMDLRGFGESSRVLNTGGWKEAEDVEAAIAYFRKTVPVTKVHVYAESLGAAAAIIASANAAAKGRKLVDGSILAVSPYADAASQVQYLDTQTEWREEFYMVHWFFTKLLRLSGAGAPDFRTYMHKAAHVYGVDVDELYRRSSAVDRVREVNVPTLILLSDDDPVVPEYHPEAFEEALKGAKNPALWRLAWGSHCLYEMQDPTWFWTVLSEFFDFYCLLPGANHGDAE